MDNPFPSVRTSYVNVPQDPLFRFFDREVKLGAAILRTVRADLRELQEICRDAIQ